jgi:hypothetical protein
MSYCDHTFLGSLHWCVAQAVSVAAVGRLRFGCSGVAWRRVVGGGGVELLHGVFVIPPSTRRSIPLT